MLFVATRTIKKCILNEYGPACGYTKKSLVKNTLTIISSWDENMSVLCFEVVFDYRQKTSPRSKLVVSKTELQIERCDTI